MASFIKETHTNWYRLISHVKIVSQNHPHRSVQLKQFSQPRSQDSNSRNNSIPSSLKEIKQESIVNQLAKLERIPYNLQKALHLSIKSRFNTYKISSTKQQRIQTMINIKTDDIENEDEEERKGIDLICVIDVSGSMKGTKLNLVKQALLTLLNFIKDKDRISLIKFNSNAEIILQFTTSSQKNQQIIKNSIQKLQAGGGTNIGSGLNLAFSLIKNKKQYLDNITSIFLLTDGLDNHAYQTTCNYLKQNLVKQTNFTLNCFGFGNDHDQVQLNKICTLKQGSFYYIEQLNSIKGCFANAIGALLSVVGLNMNLYIKNASFKPFEKIQIHKTYGEMWNKEGISNGYMIKLAQLVAGNEKGYMCELILPPMDIKIQDFQRRILVLDAFLQVQNKQKMIIKKQANLIINLLNQNQKMVQLQQDGEVMENYFRVRGAEALTQAMELADSGKYQQGQNHLDKIMTEIVQNKKVNQQNLKPIVQSLKQSKKRCQQYEYCTTGAKYMSTITRSFGSQESTLIGDRQLFENKTQKKTVKTVENVKRRNY